MQIHKGDATQNLLDQQKRDEIKTKYCIDKNIPLIRIPYWEYDNIENILARELGILT